VTKKNRGFADRTKKYFAHQGGSGGMTVDELTAHCAKYGSKNLSAWQIKVMEQRGVLKK